MHAKRPINKNRSKKNKGINKSHKKRRVKGINKSHKKGKSLGKKECPPNMSPVKIKGQLICIGRCPHSGGPIYYNPKLDKLVCKWHGSQFSLTGKVETPPAASNLKVKKI